MPGQHLPADHSRGDANTVGGYAAVHARPAAFEGSDGMSYSVEVATAPTGRAEAPWGAYLLFVRWSRLGATTPEGHLESDFLAESDDEVEARAIVGTLALDEVRRILLGLLADRAERAPERRWWDVRPAAPADSDGDDASSSHDAPSSPS